MAKRQRPKRDEPAVAAAVIDVVATIDPGGSPPADLMLGLQIDSKRLTMIGNKGKAMIKFWPTHHELGCSQPDCAAPAFCRDYRGIGRQGSTQPAEREDRQRRDGGWCRHVFGLSETDDEQATHSHRADRDGWRRSSGGGESANDARAFS